MASTTDTWSVEPYSKIGQKNFDLESFTEKDAQLFDPDATISIMRQISSKLSQIATDYDNIRKGYAKCLKCTTNGKQMDVTNNADAKKINKFKKKADKRADVVTNRKKELANLISNLQMQLDIINANNDKNLDTADSSVTEADANEG